MSIYNEPRIIKETSNGLFFHTIQDEMLSHREIELIGQIESESVNSIIRQIRYLAREEPGKEITIYINSPGGEVTSGLALYDVMKAVKCPIRTVCIGTAASMGAVLFAAGDQRDMLPHTRVMIHDPLISRTGGNALSLKAVSDDLMRTREITCRILAEHTGKQLEEIYEKTATDSWFYAEEAVRFGLADRVIDEI
ncbi:MAG: ATP-dependent Clp protease proteolytic subunit [Oscillospiraceae bacterium]|nr:ATP-dependent Clp protease proteolytic subunit [Oscillospiraceae bacterium]